MRCSSGRAEWNRDRRHHSTAQVPSRARTLQCTVIMFVTAVFLQIAADYPSTILNMFICDYERLICDFLEVLEPFYLSSRTDISESAGGSEEVSHCSYTVQVFLDLHMCVFMEDPLVRAQFAHEGVLKESWKPFVKMKRQMSLVIVAVEIPLCIVDG